MKKVFLASHGSFADGLKDAITFLMGDLQLNALSCYHEQIKDMEALSQIIDEQIANLQPDDELVVFTDLLGGSVNNVVAQRMLQNDNIHVIAGMSMPLVLEFMLCGEDDTKTAIESSLQRAKESMVYVNAQFK